MNGKAGEAADPFRVTPWMNWLGRWTCDRPRLMRRLAAFENRLLAERLSVIGIEAPIWITGLARSGTTILLEILAAHPDVATQYYRDFPPVLTPWLWNRFLEVAGTRRERPVERAHRDRIMVTADSPEAFEEPLWMNFFPRLHDPAVSQVLDEATDDPEFEYFLRSHVRKLLLVRSRERYLAKANYNATRLLYLLRVFNDARFVVPVREPLAHVASLMKQHRLFCEGQARHPEAVQHLARTGHFEFGRDRRPVHCGDDAAVQEMLALRDAGREAEAWAIQWAQVYGLIARQLDSDAALREAVLVVRYEDLCGDPGGQMRRILDHCRLEPVAAVTESAKRRLSPPSYYRPKFTAEERRAILDRTSAVAERFGYRGSAAAAG
jgi:hypothetical protein